MHNFNEFVYSRERGMFGRQCLFSDRNELLLSVQPSGRLRTKYIMANPVDKKTQLSGQMALSVIETENVELEQHGINHYEGGWPKDVNINDEEQTLRHRKKTERDDSWGVQVGKIIRDATAIAYRNNSIDIYKTFFDDALEEPVLKADMSTRDIQIFHDVWMPHRFLRCCDWMPGNNRKFLTTYCNLRRLKKRYKKSAKLMSGFGTSHAFFIWDLKDPLHPIQFFDLKEVLYLTKLCPRDENQLVGGTHSGKVCIWELGETSFPVRKCPLEAAHREATTAICWVHNKANTEFYTGSLDGSVKYWDTRDVQMCTQEFLLEPDTQEIQNRQNAHGATVLEFEYTIPVRYIIGSDMGYVFVGNRKGLSPPEIILNHYRLFIGPIRVIMRNPFFVKNFLIVADWRARIWSEESKGAPSTMYMTSRSQLLCGAWSTGRCSLFATGDASGNLCFWDLLLHQRKPVSTVTFPKAISYLAFRPDGQMIAVSLASGVTHMLSLASGMTSATAREKGLIAAMFEREIGRSKFLEARVEEVKLKRLSHQQKEEERLRLENADLDAIKSLEVDTADPDEFRHEIESDEEFVQAIVDYEITMELMAQKRSKRAITMEKTVFEEIEEEKLMETVDILEDAGAAVAAAVAAGTEPADRKAA
ncbi:dynein intermediate chain 3, ciliary-like [Scaptodrosophila lebanonensis]|uniref:Dynein intermediate chain 3, ciliary-like n=1 Tax=Drosophila lebanonensis TaxID=7225 RepID=A0A6J2TWX4_DROLE|nr:dynein intermediate chain 3, ciliary-like [Scaptodrosophila lebanonensis]